MNTVKLVRHGVENDVDTHGIGFLLGEFTKIPFVLAFAFPAVSEICIVANDTHDTAVIVEDGPVVNFVRSVALVSYDPIASAVVADRVPDAWDLGFFIKIEDHVEDGMID